MNLVGGKKLTKTPPLLQILSVKLSFTFINNGMFVYLCVPQLLFV